MSEEDHGADVYDPVEADLQHLKELGASAIDFDFESPQAARFLAQQLKVKILELRETKLEVRDARAGQTVVRDTCEKLRVSNAKLSGANRIALIEFPAGILCGLAVNLLVSNRGDFLGWALLFIGIIFFLVVRAPEKLLDTSLFGRKEEPNE